MEFEIGENAKLYRFIPMFPDDIAPQIPASASVDLVNQNRLNFRPIENVPGHRDRVALAAHRINHRFHERDSRPRRRADLQRRLGHQGVDDRRSIPDYDLSEGDSAFGPMCAFMRSRRRAFIKSPMPLR